MMERHFFTHQCSTMLCVKRGFFFFVLCAALNPKAQALFFYSRSNSGVRRQDRANCDKMEGFWRFGSLVKKRMKKRACSVLSITCLQEYVKYNEP